LHRNAAGKETSSALTQRFCSENWSGRGDFELQTSCAQDKIDLGRLLARQKNAGLFGWVVDKESNVSLQKFQPKLDLDLSKLRGCG
jgi:hypothetical protein